LNVTPDESDEEEEDVDDPTRITFKKNQSSSKLQGKSSYSLPSIVQVELRDSDSSSEESHESQESQENRDEINEFMVKKYTMHTV